MAEKQCGLLKNGGGMTTVRFPDYSRVIHTDDANFSASGITPWTATEDCWVMAQLDANSIGIGAQLFIDGNTVSSYYNQNLAGTGKKGGIRIIVPVKKGSVISSRTGQTTVTCVVTVYGML